MPQSLSMLRSSDEATERRSDGGEERVIKMNQDAREFRMFLNRHRHLV